MQVRKQNLLITKYKQFKKKILKKLINVKQPEKERNTKYTNRYYYLKKEKKSNQNTSLKQRPIIKKNEWVKKGQILVDNNSTNNGELAIGKNMLIGYLCWEGYNFEDAIIISEKIVKSDIFTSIHIKKYKTFILNDKSGEVWVKKLILK